MVNAKINIRLPSELDERVRMYCKTKKIESMSEFYRAAAVKYLTPDIEDKTLVFESLKDLHSRLHSITQQQDVFFNFFCFFIKHFFVYNAEIPQEHQLAATRSALQRFDEMFKGFQKDLKSNSSLFESLLADFFEER